MSSSDAELVSVVIPTRNRPGLVGRAVRSALAQTATDLEVIVIVDGPDEQTVQVLAQLAEPRLRIVSLPQSVGAQEARNAGVREALGRWVAFLDDDDEWLPAKLERQLAAARASRWAHPLVSCGLLMRTPEGDIEWPSRVPGASESVADYLLLRTRSEAIEVRLQTSTLMTTRALLGRVPWRRCAHDEWDLLLRASALEGAGLAFAPGPLVIWHSDAGAERLSCQLGTWRRSAEWFRSVRPLVGRRQALAQGNASQPGPLQAWCGALGGPNDAGDELPCHRRVEVTLHQHVAVVGGTFAGKLQDAVTRLEGAGCDQSPVQTHLRENELLALAQRLVPGAQPAGQQEHGVGR